MRHEAARAVYAEMGFAPERVKPGEALLYGLARTYGLVVRELAAVYARFGLSPSSFNLLMLLKHGADPASFTQQAIGSRLVVSPSDMTGLIDRLEKKGLVQRTPGRDRRCKLLRITEKGRRLLDEVWPVHAGTVERVAGGLPGREIHTLLAALGRLRETAAG